MHKGVRKVGIFILKSMLWLFFPGIALAQTTHRIYITLDPALTTVKWTLGDVLHTVRGTFKMERGVISCDPFTGEASGLIEIDAKSGESGNSTRDRKMHREILNSTEYQIITFRPNHVGGEFGQRIHGDFMVEGILNIHGQDHPIKMKVSVQPKGIGLVIETRFAIPYVQWGLKDPSTLMLRVNKEVLIDIDAVATASNKESAGSHP